MSNYNSQLQSNNTDLQMVLQTLQTKAAGGEQATPVISVNSSNGLITATAGTKTSTYQLAFQAAKTITPTITSQIAVSSGHYTGGSVMVAGDANLIAGNIKSGVSIFGVSGTLVEGDKSGDGYDEADSLITMNFSTYTNNRVTSIGAGAFAYASNLKLVDFSNVKTIDNSAFYGCSKLTIISFPVCTSVGNGVFAYCSSLTTASFPACTSIEGDAFKYCSSLTTINFPACIAIGNYAFQYCYNLTTISFPSCTTISSYAFQHCRSLTIASFPACRTIGSDAFQYCYNLTTISFPSCTTINGYAFLNCYNLTTIGFPACTTIGNYAFQTCSSLTTASFPACRTIGSYVFSGCYNLKSLYLTGSSLCTLKNSSTFSSTPIGGYSASAGTYGSIYVPASLLTSYQTATNWTYFSSRFVAIGGNIIKFTIDRTEYQAEEGMTWAEWCDSEYNTVGAYITSEDNTSVRYRNEGSYVCENDFTRVQASQIIKENYSYIEVGGGSSD